jgi:hypothetical protein
MSMKYAITYLDLNDEAPIIYFAYEDRRLVLVSSEKAAEKYIANLGVKTFVFYGLIADPTGIIKKLKKEMK